MSQLSAKTLAPHHHSHAEASNPEPLAPLTARRFAILTCLDARLDPTRLLGVPEDSAHVIRNAGGRASDDVITALIASHQALGTREWFLIQHTDCGERLQDQDLDAVLAGKASAIVTGKSASFADLSVAVGDDLHRIRQHPQLPAGIQVFGYVYDVRHNLLIEVPASRTAAVRASPTVSL
jgi:carbonic anhydrase